ncbi:hypothetical protein EQG41_04450 [Billgrantia azerbaijanica]|nr:hypothetical protein EQG41_04450 [Halomonas azerbaijanica]
MTMEPVISPGRIASLLIRQSLGAVFFLVNRGYLGFLPSTTKTVAFFRSRANWSAFVSYRALMRGKAGRRDLWRLARLYCHLEDHGRFEQACQTYDTVLCLKPSIKRRFLGKGWGENSLNVYRQLWDTEGQCLFEKVLFKPSDDYSRLSFFMTFLMPKLNGEFIKTPVIRDMHEGKHLAAVYYEHLDVAEAGCLHFSQEDRLATIVTILRELGNLECADVRIRYPEVLDYASVQAYREGQCYLHRLVRRSSSQTHPELHALVGKKLVDDRRVISHGDLVAENFSRDGWVWDWDRCGYYPVGFDLAWATLNAIDFVGFDDLMQHNERLIGRIYPTWSRRDKLVANTVYFTSIFYCRKFKPGNGDAFLMECIRYLHRVTEELH